MEAGLALYASLRITAPPIDRCISIRHGDSVTVASAAAHTSSGTPTARPAATAAAALSAMWTPLIGSATSALPHGVRRMKRGRARSSSTRPSTRTSPPWAPNVSTCAAVSEAIARTRSSSALSTAQPDAGRLSTSSALARATPSIPPRRSVWAAATRVTTPTVGRATVQSRAISPSPRIPISSTSASLSSGALRTVAGSPQSLFRLFSLAAVRQRAPSTSRARSFTLVLPTEPVMPTTRSGKRDRPHAPRSRSARVVSATSTAVAPPLAR
ncbi:unannotated protein [freshwater metagenome]|uniref:Unannotated protein n=1 Tax=freshwater metagenome TaxID=449393 RepID=A0A6J7UW84_9ZZZZ